MAVLNGRIPPALLGKIPGTGVLFPLAFIPQAEAFRAAFYAEFGKPLVITDGYRPYSGNYFAQVETMLRRYKPAEEYRRITGSTPVGRKSHVWEGVRRYLLPGQAQVAFPGTSKHGDSEAPALDLGSGVNVMDSREHKWVVANAPRFGFRWPAEWARRDREPWHVEAVGVVHVSNTTQTPGVNIPNPDGSLPDPLRPEDELDANEKQQLAELHAALVDGGAQNSLAHLVSFTAEIPWRTRDEVWRKPVSRYSHEDTNALNDLVRGTTAALETQAAFAALTAALTQVAGAQGFDAAAVTEAARAGAEAALANYRLTITPTQ